MRRHRPHRRRALVTSRAIDRQRGFVAGALAVALLGALGGLPAAAQDQTTITAPAPDPLAAAPPRAYIVVDATSGAVLDARDDRTPLPPASLTKILTALVAVAALPPDSAIPVTARAAAMPARKLNMKAGEVWDLEDTLHALLLSSANDAGAALAERVSGSLERFTEALHRLATHLRMADTPSLHDASGLDDHDSVGGGNLISARDLAIAARALLAEPRLAPIVATPVYRFTDPGGVPHKLGNHNKLLTRYPGAIGLKTGYTKRAGHGLVAAASRNGRTTVAVIMNAGDTYGWAARLLDASFARAVPATGDRLPATPPALRMRATSPGTAAVSPLVTTPPVAASPAPSAVASPDTQPAASGAEAERSGGALSVARLAVLGFAALAALRARVKLRRWRRKRRRASARVRPGVVVRRPNVLTPNDRPRGELAERFHAMSRD